MPVFNPIDEAFTVALKLKDLAEKCQENNKLGEPIAKKAKELPGLIATAGLVPGLAFYLSKTENEALYKTILEYLQGTNPLLQNCSQTQELKNTIVNELGGGEKSGYTTLTAATAHAIHLATERDVSDKKKLIETLKQIKQGITQEAVIEAQVLEYLQELKKLATALFEEGEPK